MGVPTAYQNSDSDSSTTKSAVEKGELIIRNKEQQKQDINELSRDTESANNPLKQIFDKQKELDKIETVELIKDIAQQAKSVMNKYDRIQAQNDVDKNKDALSKLEAEKAYNKLSDAEKAKYKTVEDYYNQNKDYFYYVAVDEQLKTNRENNKNLGGMGSDVSKGIDSAISIVTGIITGDITGGLAGASAPWVAEQIKIQTGDNETARLISHAILGAVVAELQGNSGLAGGAGAVTGELAADIIRKQLYGKDVKDLTEAEKENISALAQLATGLAVASVGGDVGDVSTGIAAGKNAVENNDLKDFFEASKEIAEYKCYTDSFCNNLPDDTRELAILQETVVIQQQMVEPYKEAVNALAFLGNIIADFTPILGDMKAFAEAEDAIDYAIATAGVLPGVGDLAAKLLNEAKVALKLGDVKKANELIHDAQQQVKALDVGSYRELKAKEKVGDMLEHDHIPSFAALKAKKEKEIGRELTKKEERELYQNATAVEVPKDVHQAGPTYGGKNTPEQIQKDAKDLCGAVCRDTDALRKNMIEKGYDPKQVEDAINKILERNKEMGIY